jgi:sulfur carrier protein ThiS
MDGKLKLLTMVEGSTLREAAKICGLGSQTAIMIVNGKVCHPSTKLAAQDTVELLPVIYGG